MNYDQTDIPFAYDRGRSYGPEYFKLWMDAVSPRAGRNLTETVLDLGCGTGRFSEALGSHLGAKVFGLDPSQAMLRQARKKGVDGRIRYARGRAEAVPFSDGAFDLIFMSMVFHHLEDRDRAARECRRVTRGRGRVFVRTGTRERIEAYPFVAFFPASQRILEQRIPAGNEVRHAFEAAGFRTVLSDAITQLMAPSWALYADRLAHGADSILASLSECEREAGFGALRSHAARVENQAVYETVDFFVFNRQAS